MATPIPANRARFTVEEIAAATGGTIVRAGPPTVGVFTDSRAVEQGSAFVALVGDRFDGHAFLEQAANLGASTLIVARDGAANESAVVRVGDTKKALGDLARAHRERWAREGGRAVIAITGSAGKTTTKTATARLLEAVAPGRVHASAGNLNNDIGVPMSLLGLGPEHQYGVIEVGTSGPGEIANLASIARADVAVLTLVAPAHTEGLGTVDDVAREKGALLEALSPSGLAIVNADDERAIAQLGRTRAARRTYGRATSADYRIAARDPRGVHGAHLRIERPSGSALEFESPLLGDAGALAVTAAIAVVEAVLGRPVSSDELRAGLAGLAAGVEGRLSPIVLGDGSWVLDDTYNANPASMRSSIAVALEIAREGRRRVVLVLGEMRELGDLSAHEHDELGSFVAARDVAHLVAVGGDAERIARAVSSAGKSAVFARDAGDAVSEVLPATGPGDVILVKGSRSIGTEKIVRALLERGGRA